MESFKDLFDLISAKPTEADTRAKRADLVLRAGLGTVALGAVYGLAAGSSELGLALANLYKVPMVIVLSALSALPLGLLVWKLSGAPNRMSDLFIGTVAGTFTGALVLAALAPVVALYYHSSAWLGGVLALVAATTAAGLGSLTLLRSVLNAAPPGAIRLKSLLPVGAILFMQYATMLQFIHIASPIIPETTVFDGGADALFGQ